MTSEKLRIGLIIDGYNVPNWTYHIADRIVKSNSSEIVVVIKVEKKREFRTKEYNILFQKFIAYDRQAYEVEHDATEVKSLLDIIDISEIQPITLTSQGQFIPIKKVGIKDLRLDVLLKFDSDSNITQFEELSRYGVWYYYVGNYPKLSPTLYGVREFLEKQEVTKTTLSSWMGEGKKEIKLFESYSRTDPHSVHRSLNNTYWKAVSFMPRKLNELFLLGPELFFKKEKNMDSGIVNCDRTYKPPNAIEISILLFKYFVSKLKNKISELQYFDQWILLYKLSDKKDISINFSEFKRLTPPKDRFWADPFVIFNNDTYFIFIEELIYKNGKGTIAVIEMDNNTKYIEPQIILKSDYHMSYPFIIEDQGIFYMLPETEDNNRIELFECIDFPLTWKLKEVLFNNIRAVDSTILKYNGKYWLFTNIQENEGTFTSDDELFLFYSDSLLNGNWTPHPQNPIVSDVRNARPAGRVYTQNGRLYRPAQNCAKHYGHGIQIHEIITLTEDKYEERIKKSILPDWNKDLISTHTLNHDNRLTFIDAKIKRKKS